MSADDEHRFASIETRLASMEAGMLKRDAEISSIINTLTRIEMLLGGTMGSEGLVKKVESTHSRVVWFSGLWAGAVLFIEHFISKIK